MKKWKIGILFLCIMIMAGTVCVAAKIINHIEDTEGTEGTEKTEDTERSESTERTKNDLKPEQKDENDTAICEEEKSLEEQVQTILDEFFDNFFATVLEDSDADFRQDDFAGIDGYIAAKYFVSQRYTYNTLLGGIHKVDLKKVTVDELSDQGDHLEARVYVNFTYYYGDNDSCRGGAVSSVTLEKSGEQYKVIDLDLNDGVEIRMAKEASLANMKAAGATDPYPFIDAYFQQLKKNTDSMKQ